MSAQRYRQVSAASAASTVPYVSPVRGVTPVCTSLFGEPGSRRREAWATAGRRVSADVLRVFDEVA